MSMCLAIRVPAPKTNNSPRMMVARCNHIGASVMSLHFLVVVWSPVDARWQGTGL